MDFLLWTPPVPALASDEPETARNYDYIDDQDNNTLEIKSERKDISIESARFINSKLKMIIKGLIKNEGLFRNIKEERKWIEVLADLSWKACVLIKPNYDEGRKMDPRSYLKVKCIATGTCNDSQEISGLVFSKIPVHKRMSTKFENPKFVLVKGVFGQSHSISLSSLDSMAQEKDDLRNSICAMIDSYGPDIILVEKKVSHDIQQLFLNKGITLIHEMKLHRLEKIAQCTDSPILNFSDFIKKPILNECKSFQIMQFAEEYNINTGLAKRSPKNLMFLEGLSRPLGCTVLLRGASTKDLKKIKKILQYAVYKTYDLICEASFFRNILSKSSSIISVPSISNSWSQESFESSSNLHVERTSILVSVSKQCVAKQVNFDEGNLLHMKYYDHSDFSIGQFLKNFLMDNEYCRSCGESPDYHTHSYTHKNGSINVHLQNCSPRGMKLYGGIWTWIRCSKCMDQNGNSRSNYKSKRFLMPNSALNFSFGKFLELCFSDDNSSSHRLSSCSHSFPQDCLLFFGTRSRAIIMFNYSSTDNYTACGPSKKLDLNIPRNGNNFLMEELHNIVSERAMLFSDVSRLLHQMKDRNVNISSMLNKYLYIEGVISQVENMAKQEKIEFKDDLIEALKKIQNNEVGEYEKNVTINWLRQYLLLETYVWDRRLNHLFQFEKTKKMKTMKLESESWIWNPLSISISEFKKKDIRFGYMEKFHLINNYTPINLFKLHEDFTNEKHNSRKFILGPNGNISSIYEGQISSIISCGLSVMEEFSLFQKNTPPKPSQSDFLSFTAPELHPKITIDEEFGLEESLEYTVTCYHAKDFDNLRKKCFLSPVEYRSSLSRCKDWDIKVGKTQGLFAKTMDEMLILKHIKEKEMESFLQIAPHYFSFVSECLDSETKSCLAKILGIYQVKQIKNGKEIESINLMVMENILFGRKISRSYHIKEDRLYKHDSNSNDQEMVYFDLNFVKSSHISSTYVTVESKRLMGRTVWNDLAFLAAINMTNYSLLVGIDEERKELVYGIINYLEQYSLVMKIENCFRSFKYLEPKEYRKRFRTIVTKYFLAIPES